MALANAPIPLRRNGAKRALQQWVRAELAQQDEVSAPALRDAALTWLRGHPDLLDDLMQEVIGPIVHDQVLETIRTTRLSPEQKIRALTSLNAGTAQSGRVDGLLKTKWQRWLERCGESHIRVLRMRRADLLQAATQREQHVRTSAILARLWRTLAAELPDDTLTVGERWSPQELEAHLLTIEAEYDARQPTAP